MVMGGERCALAGPPGGDARQVMLIAPPIDAMAGCGPDGLLRKRLASLRSPHPLSFGRLMFHPLDPLIVPAVRWRPGRPMIPRSALAPMADHVRLTMGAAADEIAAEIDGRTTADGDLIVRTGRLLWPLAAEVLDAGTVPWGSTGLGDYRVLAGAVAALLREAVTLYAIQEEAATGLLPPRLSVIHGMISRAGRAGSGALPMMIAVLLDRVPEAAMLLAEHGRGLEASGIESAMDAAADLLLRQIYRADAVEIRIAVGTLAEAGTAAHRMMALLRHLGSAKLKPDRRQRLRVLRQRLDDACRVRFTTGLEDAFLQAGELDDLPALETAARGLRVLETEARLAGSGPVYDRLLEDAAGRISDAAMRKVDRIRLVEILRGPGAALAMLNALA